MPSPKDKAKATGDTHPPEVEADDLPLQESHPEGTGTPGTQERHRDPEGQGSHERGGHRAGLVREDDEPA